MSELTAIILAAGHGTRMRSALPKVLHRAAGRPLVYYPVKAALDLGAARVIVVVNPATKEPICAELGKHISPDKFAVSVQEVPRGTGDAARAGALGLSLDPNSQVILLSGDVPLLEASDLKPLVHSVDQGSDLAFMTFSLGDPTGYGRVLRDQNGNPREIREHRDLKTESEHAVTEVNAGVYAARAGALLSGLAALLPDNAQNELYLTDIVRHLAAKGASIQSTQSRPEVLAGVNDRSQLWEVEQVLFARIRARHGRAGVSITGQPLIDDTVEIAAEATIEDGCRLRGKTSLGARTVVDVGSVIIDTVVGEDVYIKPYCVLGESEVRSGVQLGPFAHLRPNTLLEENAHIGNFVETKNTTVRRGAKANHLTYLGDAELGEKSNVGAGTIVCNYDGYRKQRTVIGAGVFIGSDSQLVAPLTIGDGAYVATATTVTSDVPANALAIGRCRQQNKLDYAPQLRERLSQAGSKKPAGS